MQQVRCKVNQHNKLKIRMIATWPLDILGFITYLFKMKSIATMIHVCTDACEECAISDLDVRYCVRANQKCNSRSSELTSKNLYLLGQSVCALCWGHCVSSVNRCNIVGTHTHNTRKHFTFGQVTARNLCAHICFLIQRIARWHR